MTEPNNELDMFNLFELTPDLVCIVNKDGTFKKINKAVIQKLKYTEEELYAVPVSSFIYEADRELTAKLRASLLDNSQLLNFENRYISKTGEIIWLSWTSIYLPEHEYVFAIAKDITEKKEKELAIEENFNKFKSLATHFKSSMEKDRKYFASELHEEIAQLASVVKIDLEWIELKLNSSQAQLSERINHAVSVTSLLIKTIKRISLWTSPVVVEDIGLVESLRYLSQEYTELYEIDCRFKENCEEPSLPHEMKMDFFRVCQEVISHATLRSGADNIEILLEEKNERYSLAITYNGKAIDINSIDNETVFIDVRKRVASVNGNLEIQSVPGTGTTVCFSIAR